LGLAKNKQSDFDGSARLLDGLARELKLSLTFIARSAEHQSGKQAIDFSAVERSAGDSLKLIDSYLLCAQTEYGQQLLPLEPVGMGSVLYEVAENFQPQKKRLAICTDYNEPVMANKRALVAALYSLAKIVISSQPDTKEDQDILLVSQKRRRGDLSVGVFAKGFSAKPSEIQRAGKLLGRSDMALSNQTFSSGVDLTIAWQLASSMNGRVFACKYRGRGGLSLGLLKSDQLSLVGNG
jgi:hypothetical protein